MTILLALLNITSAASVLSFQPTMTPDRVLTIVHAAAKPPPSTEICVDRNALLATAQSAATDSMDRQAALAAAVIFKSRNARTNTCE